MTNDPSILRTIEQSKALLKPNQKCIINTDIDGILCGILLQNILNWKVVGFCDSKESIWMNPHLEKEFNAIVFVDIYLAKPSFKCIDQHIVAKDLEHVKLLSENINKQNPNHERYRYASSNSADKMSYKWKYPFGTIHYLIACLESLGYEIDIKNSKFFSVSSYDLLLRADNAAISTVKDYKENALDWWEWLKELGGKQIEVLAAYCVELEESHAQKSYDELAVIFKNTFHCNSKDGNFSNNLNVEGLSRDSITDYIDKVAESLGLSTLQLERRMNLYKGNYLTESTNDKKAIDDILNDKELSTYAYVYKDKLSYTLGPFKKANNQ
jgi:hypothetical protein